MVAARVPVVKDLSNQKMIMRLMRIQPTPISIDLESLSHNNKISKEIVQEVRKEVSIWGIVDTQKVLTMIR
jgi:uncharacterized membrane protein YjjP (DUF1212 family)